MKKLLILSILTGCATSDRYFQGYYMGCLEATYMAYGVEDSKLPVLANMCGTLTGVRKERGEIPH